MKELYDVKERLIDEIKEYSHAGKLTKEDAMYLKALSGAADHICNILDKGEYSGEYRPYSYKRDSMGRYSRTGIKDKLHDLMDEASDDRTRDEIRRLIDKM